MTRKRLYVLGCLFLIALLVLGIFVLRKPRDIELKRLTLNLQSAWLHNDDIYFNSGSFFAKYNLAQNKVDRLSDYIYIQSGATGLSWSPDAVVFQTSPSGSDRDDVTTAAYKLGVSPYLSHWWRYDFKLKQYQLLLFSDIDQCKSVVQVSPGLLACSKPQTSGNGAFAIKIYDINARSSRVIFETDDVPSGLSSDGKKVYFVLSGLTGKQSLYSVSATASYEEKAQKLHAGEGRLSYAFSDNNDVLLDETPLNPKTSSGSETEESPHLQLKHKVILLQSGQEALSKTIKTTPASLYAVGGDLFFSSTDGSVYRVSRDGFNKNSTDIRSGAGVGDLIFKHGGFYYVLRSNGDLLFSGKEGSGFKQPSEFSKSKDSDPKGRWWIDAEENGSRGVYLYSKKSLSSDQQKTVGDFLVSRNFRPSEFNFKWIMDGIGIEVPISPKAMVIK